MDIIVLNGSPKGQSSVTMQYVAFLAKTFPAHTFACLNVAQEVRRLEADPAALADVLARIRRADAVLWAFPVYFFLVPAQYKRFIELVAERGAVDAFQGKYAAALTTSIRFFDHTAHNYIRAIAEDWGMNFAGGYSAEMRDLFNATERERLRAFAEGFLAAVDAQAPTFRVNPPLLPVTQTYTPGPAAARIDTAGRKLLIVHDARPDDTNLLRMLARFAAAFAVPPETVNLHELDIRGGCLGCMACAYDNNCVYSGRDGYVGFYNEKIKTADILIFTGAIRDRYLSARWKTYFDRSFFNNHVPTLGGKQVAFLISGPFGQLANLRQILEAYTSLQEANLVGIVSDEADSPAGIDALLDRLAGACAENAARGYIQPPTFLVVGGRKIFRDEVWGRLRFPFVADHRYYLATDRYDFPHRDWGARLNSAIMYWLAHIPAFRRQVYGPKMNEHMLVPFKKILSSL